ncbi:hypothetical protein FKM82_023599 [Ascaphus truei]
MQAQGRSRDCQKPMAVRDVGAMTCRPSPASRPAPTLHTRALADAHAGTRKISCVSMSVSAAQRRSLHHVPGLIEICMYVTDHPMSVCHLPFICLNNSFWGNTLSESNLNDRVTEILQTSKKKQSQ